MSRIGALGAFPARWWARQSLRARLTLLATALFTVAVTTGAVLVLFLQRYTLLRTLDSSAEKSAADIAQIFDSGKSPATVVPTTGGISAIQVVDDHDRVISVCCGADRIVPMLNARQVAEVRAGGRLTVSSSSSDAPLRVLGAVSGDRTVLVATDLKNVDDSVRLLGRVALIGGPLAVLLMALATYGVVALTLRSVAALRHGAAAITAAGLSDQRLPVPGAQDEIHRLAVTLNAMLDRIDLATTRQRTFVGDAAHELRSPLASVRVQLEVAQRLGPETDISTLVDDVLIDVGRLDRLVQDLLALARLDETTAATGSPSRIEAVRLDRLLRDVVDGYRVDGSGAVRVPVTADLPRGVSVAADPDGVRRVVVNLVDNAVRFARSAVQVTLAPAPDLDGDSDGQRTVAIVVTDDGPGIAPEERERVFDRFYRVQASRSRESGGTGLGLAIVRDVVRAHGGSVRLQARPDGASGLQVVVLLPVEDQ